MSFAISEVVARAGVGDPWERAGEVTAADPGVVTSAAAGFAEAAGHARTAVRTAEQADAVTAASYLVDRTAVHDAAATTTATRAALGDGGEHLERIARMLASVATDLATTQDQVRSALTALEQQLNAITAASSPSSGPGAAAAAEQALFDQALFDQAVAAVRTHGGTIATELDGYNGVLAKHIAMLADLGYAPLDQADPDDEPSVLTDAQNVIGALGEAALDNPGAVIGLLAGSGLVATGVGAVLAGGTVTVGSGGTLAAGGVPTAAAGVGLVGVGGALLVGAVDRLTNAAMEAYARRAGDAKQPSSTRQVQKDIERRRAPKSVERADKGRIAYEKDHLHFKDGNAINKDGTWKHGGRKLKADEEQFLRDHGWELPR